MLRRSPALLACFLCLVIGGMMLGAGDAVAAPIIHGEPINWDAIAAMGIIASGLITGNWAMVKTAVQSAIRASEAAMRLERADQPKGFVTRDLCRERHQDAERRLELLEIRASRSFAVAGYDRIKSDSEHRTDEQRLEDLEAKA